MVQAGSTIAHRDEQAIVWHSLDISQAIAKLNLVKNEIQKSSTVGIRSLTL